MMDKTKLGKYLYSMRINRKEENIKEYVLKYKLPISESYYRDVESGRKMLRLDTAKVLCDSLDLEEEIFFYYFLMDSLPEKVFCKLIKEPAINDPMYDSASEGVTVLKSELDMYRNAFVNKIIKRAYHADDEVIEYLFDNIQYLPLVHYIYMREYCTFNDIQELSIRNNINQPIDELLSIIDSHKIAQVDYVKGIVLRFGEEFECPQNRIGHALKNKFLQ